MDKIIELFYFNPSRPVHVKKLYWNKNLNFYFHTSLWYLKRFYKGLQGLPKTLHHKEVWK